LDKLWFDSKKYCFQGGKLLLGFPAFCSFIGQSLKIFLHGVCNYGLRTRFKRLNCFIPLILVIAGFIYMNLIFNRKIEKEEKDKDISIGKKGRKNGS